MWIKLSELKGEAVIEFPALVMDSIERIAKDPEASEIFKTIKSPEGISPEEFAMRRLNAARVALLKNHGRDVAIIMAADSGVSLDEYLENIDLATYGNDVFQMMVDPIMRNFFQSAQLMQIS